MSNEPTPAPADRFLVTYRLSGSAEQARALAEAICIEQTVEVPLDVVPEHVLQAQVLGRIEDLVVLHGEASQATISYRLENAGIELTQLLNVIFGNSSMLAGVRVESLGLPPALLAHYAGPRFGRAGLRTLLGAPERPLLCTALKPLGRSAAELAELTYQFALGGIDLIKDDHGLADQRYAPFAERVARCGDAVARANAASGQRCIYAPNISAPAHLVRERAITARDAGAGALMVAPGLVGLDVLRQLADDDAINLPILLHPALWGSFVTSPQSGIAHGPLFGTLARLAGADVTIFPNYGGRFAFSPEECRSIAQATEAPLGALKPIFPAPAGGMNFKRVPELRKHYGSEVVFLIGGALYQYSRDLSEAARAFHAIVASATAEDH